MANHRKKILLAEDDPNLGLLLVDYLGKEGYEVKLCNDGEQALDVFTKGTFHLCLLDIMMPKLDGFNVLKQIREMRSQMPVIFITARSLKDDKMKGYYLGADDYITKPFDADELLWKIEALLRRYANDDDKDAEQPVMIGQFTFDFNNQLLLTKGSTKRMTVKEAEILRCMYMHRNRILRREELLSIVWGVNDYFTGRSLDVFISKMRKYLHADTSVSIENVFGVGFIFHVPEDKVD